MNRMRRRASARLAGELLDSTFIDVEYLCRSLGRTCIDCNNASGANDTPFGARWHEGDAVRNRYDLDFRARFEPVAFPQIFRDDESARPVDFCFIHNGIGFKV